MCPIDSVGKNGYLGNVNFDYTAGLSRLTPFAYKHESHDLCALRRIPFASVSHAISLTIVTITDDQTEND